MLLPLGAGTHTNAKLLDTKNVLVNLGSDVIAQKTVEEAIAILEERRKRLEATRDQLQEALIQVSTKLQQLDTNVKSILAKRGIEQP